MLWIIAGVCLACAVLCVVLCVLLRRAPKTKQRAAGNHAPLNDRAHWLHRIDTIEHKYDQGKISQEEAYVQLSQLTREFASTFSGRSYAADTLRDLQQAHRSANAESLRLTIGALYPPEFANAEHNAQAKSATVHTAAGWVADFVEGWRS